MEKMKFAMMVLHLVGPIQQLETSTQAIKIAIPHVMSLYGLAAV